MNKRVLVVTCDYCGKKIEIKVDPFGSRNPSYPYPWASYETRDDHRPVGEFDACSEGCATKLFTKWVQENRGGPKEEKDEEGPTEDDIFEEPMMGSHDNEGDDIYVPMPEAEPPFDEVERQ